MKIEVEKCDKEECVFNQRKQSIKIQYMKIKYSAIVTYTTNNNKTP